MIRFHLIIAIYFITALGICFADKISAPPPLSGEPAEEQHYFQAIYENIHRLEVVSSDPDSSRNGKKGDTLLFQSSGSNYISVNIDGSKDWSKILLS